MSYVGTILILQSPHGDELSHRTPQISPNFPILRSLAAYLPFTTSYKQEHSSSFLKGYLCVSVETQRELQLIERNTEEDTSGSEDEEASPDIGHDICLETYTGLNTAE
jgi:hypothetical protein